MMHSKKKKHTRESFLEKRRKDVVVPLIPKKLISEGANDTTGEAHVIFGEASSSDHALYERHLQNSKRWMSVTDASDKSCVVVKSKESYLDMFCFKHISRTTPYQCLMHKVKAFAALALLKQRHSDAQCTDMRISDERYPCFTVEHSTKADMLDAVNTINKSGIDILLHDIACGLKYGEVVVRPIAENDHGGRAIAKVLDELQKLPEWADACKAVDGETEKAFVLGASLLEAECERFMKNEQDAAENKKQSSPIDCMVSHIAAAIDGVQEATPLNGSQDGSLGVALHGMQSHNFYQDASDSCSSVADMLIPYDAQQQAMSAMAVADNCINAISNMQNEVSVSDNIADVVRALGRVDSIMGECFGKSIHGDSIWLDVVPGNNFAQALPVEFVAMCMPELETLFYARQAEEQMLQRALRGIDEGGNGPFIILQDKSTSTDTPVSQGDSIKIAHYIAAVSMAMLREVVRFTPDRDVHVVPFNDTVLYADCISVKKLPRNKRQVAKILTGRLFRPPTGGTFFDRALQYAFGLFAEEHLYDTGDIVLVTDGECSASLGEMVNEWSAANETSARLFGLFIGRNAQKYAELHLNQGGFTGIAFCEAHDIENGVRDLLTIINDNVLNKSA